MDFHKFYTLGAPHKNNQNISMEIQVLALKALPQLSFKIYVNSGHSSNLTDLFPSKGCLEEITSKR